jgi:gluconolactonase
MSDVDQGPRFGEVVGEGLEVEQLATGFGFTEGPIWHPDEGCLIFSDMPHNRMRRWSPEEGITIFRDPSNMANGNCIDAQGRILTCEHATSRVTRTEKDGSITVLATHWNGKELNSPNDIVVADDGSIYFTDPTYGRMEYFGVPREPELDFRGVYRIVPDTEDGHELQLLVDDFGQPNGLCLSLDGTRLFVNDTDTNQVRVFEVDGQGRLTGGRVWCEVAGESDGVADGMKVDSAGNLYCTGPGGIHVFDEGATLLGVIPSPEVVANFNWGGDDLKSLFLTASTSLYRVRVNTPGRRPF